MLYQNSQHFSEERRGLMWAYCLSFVVFCLLWFMNFGKFMKDVWNGGSATTPMLFLAIASVCQLGSVMMNIIHLFVYSSNGRGVFFIEMTALVASVVSQTMVTFLLCMLAWGWTIIRDN